MPILTLSPLFQKDFHLLGRHGKLGSSTGLLFYPLDPIIISPHLHWYHVRVAVVASTPGFSGPLKSADTMMQILCTTVHEERKFKAGLVVC
jgi:hypothetical protein